MWLDRWVGKTIRFALGDGEIGIVISDRSPGRPMYVHRYVDVLWDYGEVQEKVHTSDVEVLND